MTRKDVQPIHVRSSLRIAAQAADQTSKDPGGLTLAGGSLSPSGIHWAQGQIRRKKSKEYMPVLWPSLHVKLSA